MGTKKQVDDTKPTGGNGFVFINYDLDKETREKFKAWAHENIDEVYDLIGGVVELGYAFSVKWDDFNNCFGAFLTCNKKDDPNQGKILTARGSTAFSAITGVLYRHGVVFDGVWPEYNKKRGILDDDD